MANPNNISNDKRKLGPNRIQNMKIFDLTNDISEVFVTLTSKRNITQPREISSDKARKKLATRSPWKKDQLK